LVRLHGGEIDVESELGVGSTFTFSLGQQDPLRRYNLLLVDDDPALRDILCKVLEKADFEVATAEDGQAALLQIHRRIPDAVLMDLEMPVMDGPTAIQEIRKQWGEIPVVIHTGCVEGPLLNRALQLSPSNVVPKPCPMEQLVQIMLDLKPVRSASRHPVARLDAFTAKMNPSKATPVD
jgi:CheY-like chemotaxis protein